MFSAISFELPKLGHERSQHLWQQLLRTPHRAQVSYFVVFQVSLRAVLAVTQEYQSLGMLVWLHLREQDAQITLLKLSHLKFTLQAARFSIDSRKLKVATWFLMDDFLCK